MTYSRVYARLIHFFANADLPRYPIKNITEKYLIVYGVFRFFLEFIRGDDRGASPFGFLTPSQLMSIIMIAGGVVCYFIRKRVLRKELEKYEAAEEKPEPSIRHYDPSYKGLIYGLTHKCECPNCKQPMKVKFHSDLTLVNEVELLNKEHLRLLLILIL